MKGFLFLFPLLAACFLASCKTEPALKAELEYADSLCCVEPENAIRLLEALEHRALEENEHTLRRWQLLCIKAQDKADHPLTSDSIIKKVVAYFDRHGSAKEQIEAYYYLGRTYHELHDSPQAVTAYLKAIDLSERNGIPDARVMTNCTSQLGIVYRLQQNPRATVDIGLKGYHVAAEHGILTPILIMDVATGYDCLNMNDSTEFYYRLAMNEITRTGTENEYSGCISEIMGYYALHGRQKEAEHYYKIMERIPETYWDVNHTINKITYFEMFGPVDSAIYYDMLHIEDTLHINRMNDAARSLMEIYRYLGQYEKSSYYAHIYSETNNTIGEQLKLEQTRDANNEYKYRRDMEAEAEAYRQASQMRELIGLTFAVCITLILIGIAFYFHRKWEMERRLRLQAATIQQQGTEISQKNKDIDSLSQKMLMKGIHVRPKEVFRHFDEATTGKFSIQQEEEWEKLAAALDSVYPKFSVTAHRCWPQMKDDEFHIACLLKMGYGVSAITRATGMAKTTVHRKIGRVRQYLDDVLTGKSPKQHKKAANM